MWKLKELLRYDEEHHLCRKLYARDLDFDLGHDDFYRAKVKANMVLLIEKVKPGEERAINIDITVHTVRNLVAQNTVFICGYHFFRN